MASAPSIEAPGDAAATAGAGVSPLALSGYGDLVEAARSWRVQRSALAAGRPDDPFEREAEQVAAIAARPGAAPSPVDPPRDGSLSDDVRARVEPLLGADLSHVRVHHGPDAHRMAGQLQARAFTHGSDIYLGSGQSPHDVALMAHEATHVVQQATGAAPQVQCAPEGPAPTGGDAAALSPLPEIPSAELRPLSAQDASLLVLGLGAAGKHGVFVVPARGLVRELPARRAAGSAPQRGPVIGMTAVGHGSAVLVRTGPGVGMLVDSAGSRSGGALNVLIPPGLQALSASFGIARIDAVLIAHTHADHVGGLVELARRGNLTGSDVYVQPGLETATQGPAGQAFQELAAGRVSPVFPAGWRPTPLGVSLITGPTGQQVTTSRLVIGDTTIEMATETRVLRDFVAAVNAGRTKEASRLADAASALALIVPRAGGPAMLKVGDMRGRDIERLYDAMGDAAFRAMFGRARLLEGLHHIGAVSTRADVRGLEILLSVVGNRGDEPFTVVAQTGPDHELNQQLIRAIQLAGGRVVIVGEPDAARPGQITVRSGGQVTQSGGREWGADPVTAKTRVRAQRLERAIRVLETLPDYRSGPASRAEVIAGLRAEAQRLRGVLDARRQIGLDGVGPRPRSDGDQRLRENAVEADKVLGMERQLGDAQIARLAVSDTELGELQREVLAVRTRGEASARLRALLSTIDPQIGRELLFDALGQPMSRNQQRRAWRTLQSRIRAQRRTEALVELSGPAPGRAKAAAWLGLVLEAWELAEPFVTEAVRESREATHEDFYRSFRDLVWWTEKGINPYATGRTGTAEPDLGDDALLPGIWRRVLDDLPVAERAQRQAGLVRSNPQLMKGVADAKALRFLYIPDPAQWPGDKRAEFWHAVAEWASAHINNYDDYASEIRETPIQPIRQAPDSKAGFGARDWQLRIGVVHGDHVVETWQTATELTNIMNTTARRVVANTERERGAAWDNRTSGIPSGDVMSDAGHPVHFASDQPTAKARFSGKPQPIYSLLDGEVTKVQGFQFWDATPHFLVHAKMTTPKGYAWVSGADYNTHAALRSANTWQWLRTSKIHREKHDRDPSSPTFEKRFEPSEYMDEPGELDAWMRLVNHEPGAFFHERDGSIYRGEVRLYELGPNTSAMALVEVEELTRE